MSFITVEIITCVAPISFSTLLKPAIMDYFDTVLPITTPGDPPLHPISFSEEDLLAYGPIIPIDCDSYWPYQNLCVIS